MNANCGHSLYWRGLYKPTFDLITAESYAHPAKMSVALCFRILEHLKELGLLKDSDTVLDPMAGTGITAISAGAKGYKAVTIELEEKFIGFEQANKDYAERKLHKKLDWQILQGDARRLSELLKEKGLVTVSSPPYGEAINAGKGGIDWEKANRPDRLPENLSKNVRNVMGTQELRYSHDPANLGNLPDKPLKTVVSPPYEGGTGHGGNPTKIDAKKNITAWVKEQYGNTQGQIENENSETYLSAMATVYAEIAKVSDVLAIVIKNPTRNGKLRRLDTDTISLLELSGWKLHCRHRALLFEELEQSDLFGGTQKRVQGRMSFFKRLSWQKGQPVARWEDILICVRLGNHSKEGR